MKKLTSIILCICMLLLVSCQSTNDQKQDDNEQDNIEQDNVEYSIFYTTQNTSLSESKLESADVKLKPSSNLTFSDDNTRSKIEDTDAPQSKTYKFPLDGKEYKLSLKSSFSTVFSSAKNDGLKSFSRVDSYSAKEGVKTHVFDFNTSNGALIFYACIDPTQRGEGTESITLDAAEANAREAVTAIYGKKTLDEYVKTSASTVESGDHVLVFSRKIGKYVTEDDITVTLKSNGTLASVRALEKGTFDDAVKNLSEAQIEKAENKVKEIFADKKDSIILHKLDIDPSGTVYLSFAVSDIYYINVN